MRIKIKAGTPYEMDTNDRPTFDQWMGRVDALMYRVVGLSVYDLPDCDFYTWYNDERLRPIRAANRALKGAS